MTLNEIVKDIPVCVPLGLISATLAGMAVRTTIRVYRAQKQVNAQFDRLQKEYKPDFSKEELLEYYEKLVRNGSGLWIKRKKSSDQIIAELEKQIMVYATQEVNEAVANGAVLDFNDSITRLSPTYAKARNIVRRRIIENQYR